MVSEIVTVMSSTKIVVNGIKQTTPIGHLGFWLIWIYECQISIPQTSKQLQKLSVLPD